MRAGVAVVLVLALQAVVLAGYLIFNSEQAKPVPVGKLTPAPEGEGWIDLLDAEHAPRWKNANDDAEIFEIKDGMLHIHGITVSPLRYVTYGDEMLGDFDLHIEYMLAPRANSGIFIRKQPNDDVMRGFEIQVLDDFGKAPSRTTSGALYDVVTPMFNMSQPTGKWNSYDIAVRGTEVVVYMNGWLVLYADLKMMETPLGKFDYAFKDLPLTGLLALQDHGGEAWYRNIRIKPFKRASSPAPALAPTPAQPESAAAGGPVGGTGE